jgi:hypothetical protein
VHEPHALLSVVGYRLVSVEGCCVKSHDKLPPSACAGRHEDLSVCLPLCPPHIYSKLLVASQRNDSMWFDICPRMSIVEVMMPSQVNPALSRGGKKDCWDTDAGATEGTPFFQRNLVGTGVTLIDGGKDTRRTPSSSAFSNLAILLSCQASLP